MSTSGLNPIALARLTAAFARLIDARRLPGVVAMISRRGEVGYQVGLGKQDPQRGLAMGTDAVFRIHSMTKPIVSVATMMLVEQGRLQLSDPVALYLPTLAHVRVGVERDGRFDLVPAAKPMTIPARPAEARMLVPIWRMLSNCIRTSAAAIRPMNR